ncbi:50S ribosomal protein L16 [Patescibacteria group bacterium]|nr:50S ribosomal protein L16 [Patescibacteria group bacterium]MBU1683461.1 50S ribosomal protein L16 [Patescibacteria group bacterium]MBU1934636.1 50S ribosomal protein L16 [Patescibacteria group bacterium]
MLQPKKQKYRKLHRARGVLAGKSKGGNSVSFGSIGLKAITAGELTSRQIEAARRAMTRAVKRGGKIWIRIFPHTPITRKASEVPMGSGKGGVEFYVSRVKPGRIIFEMDGISEELAREALRLADSKLPIKTKVVLRHQ